MKKSSHWKTRLQQETSLHLPVPPVPEEDYGWLPRESFLPMPARKHLVYKGILAGTVGLALCLAVTLLWPALRRLPDVADPTNSPGAAESIPSGDHTVVVPTSAAPFAAYWKDQGQGDLQEEQVAVLGEANGYTVIAYTPAENPENLTVTNTVTAWVIHDGWRFGQLNTDSAPSALGLYLVSNKECWTFEQALEKGKVRAETVYRLLPTTRQIGMAEKGDPEQAYAVEAVVQEVYDRTLLVKPEDTQPMGDLASVSVEGTDPRLQKGTRIRFWFDGMVRDTYPVGVDTLLVEVEEKQEVTGSLVLSSTGSWYVQNEQDTQGDPRLLDTAGLPMQGFSSGDRVSMTLIQEEERSADIYIPLSIRRIQRADETSRVMLGTVLRREENGWIVQPVGPINGREPSAYPNGLLVWGQPGYNGTEEEPQSGDFIAVTYVGQSRLSPPELQAVLLEKAVTSTGTLHQTIGNTWMFEMDGEERTQASLTLPKDCTETFADGDRVKVVHNGVFATTDPLQMGCYSIEKIGHAEDQSTTFIGTVVERWDGDSWRVEPEGPVGGYPLERFHDGVGLVGDYAAESLAVGDRVRITYNGRVALTHPAQVKVLGCEKLSGDDPASSSVEKERAAALYDYFAETTSWTDMYDRQMFIDQADCLGQWGEYYLFRQHLGPLGLPKEPYSEEIGGYTFTPNGCIWSPYPLGLYVVGEEDVLTLGDAYAQGKIDIAEVHRRWSHLENKKTSS